MVFGNPEIEVKHGNLMMLLKIEKSYEIITAFRSETKNNTGDKENNNDNSKPDNSSRHNDYKHNEDSGKRKGQIRIIQPEIH